MPQRPTRRTTLYLGVKPTLERCRGEKAVATNKPGALARRIVEELGHRRPFIAVLGEDDVGRTKPDPLIVDLLRGKIGAAKRRTLYVGDSLVDADTADAAGVDLAPGHLRLRRSGKDSRPPGEIPPRSLQRSVDARFADLLKRSHQGA